MASERARHGRKTNVADYDHVKCGGSSWNKRRLARNRRRDDLAEVAAQVEAMCNCPACSGGYERACWGSAVCDGLSGDGPGTLAQALWRCSGPTTRGTLQPLQPLGTRRLVAEAKLTELAAAAGPLPCSVLAVGR